LRLNKFISAFQTQNAGKICVLPIQHFVFKKRLVFGRCSWRENALLQSIHLCKSSASSQQAQLASYLEDLSKVLWLDCYDRHFYLVLVLLGLRPLRMGLSSLMRRQADVGPALLELAGEFTPLIPANRRPVFSALLLHLGDLLEDTEYRLQRAEQRLSSLEGLVGANLEQKLQHPAPARPKSSDSDTLRPVGDVANVEVSVAVPGTTIVKAVTVDPEAPRAAASNSVARLAADARQRRVGLTAVSEDPGHARKRPRHVALPTVREVLQEDRARRGAQRAEAAVAAAVAEAEAAGCVEEKPCSRCRLAWRARKIRERGVVNEKMFTTWLGKHACLPYIHMDEPILVRTFVQQHAGAAPDFEATPTESP
jgi:hypothetical protein